MKHWQALGEAKIPDTQRRLVLYRDKDDFFIRTSSGAELMSTRKHGSEDALGAMLCLPLVNQAAPRVLIGGLGMGFTLAAALGALPKAAVVTVAELVPGVVAWNRGELGAAAGRPLDDPRTEVFEGDVVELLTPGSPRFDAIALDVDNGPEGLTADTNDWLYSDAGIAAARAALRPGGRVGYWSAVPDPGFVRRLKRSGARVDERRVHAHGKKGARHTLWLAQW